MPKDKAKAKNDNLVSPSTIENLPKWLEDKKHLKYLVKQGNFAKAKHVIKLTDIIMQLCYPGRGLYDYKSADLWLRKHDFGFLGLDEHNSQQIMLYYSQTNPLHRLNITDPLATKMVKIASLHVMDKNDYQQKTAS